MSVHTKILAQRAAQVLAEPVPHVPSPCVSAVSYTHLRAHET